MSGRWQTQSGVVTWLALALAAQVVSLPVSGDVVRDGTIGPGKQVLVSAGVDCDYCILESLGTRSGTNLYHSFSEFDVDPGETASFYGSGLTNVIARIPSSTPSTIDGHVWAESGNLFLLNPAGVIFDNDASLDIPAALAVSSADAIHFATDPGSPFVVGDPTPILSSAVPSHLSFDAGPSGDVVFNAGRVIGAADGERLTVVAGDVVVKGGTKLQSRGGLVQVAAVGDAAAIVPIDIAAGVPNDIADFDVTQQTGDLGTIRIEGSSWLNGRRGSASLPSNGRVVLRSGELHVEGGSIIWAGGEGGDDPAIDIEAQRLVDVDGSWVLDDGSDTRDPGDFHTGIRIVAPRVDLHDGASVIATSSVTLAGDIEIVANQALEVSDVSRVETINTDTSTARSSSIDITTAALTVEGGGQIGSLSENDRTPGDVTIDATNGSIFISGRSSSDDPSGVFSRANAATGVDHTDLVGNISLTAATVDIEDGALVSARTFGEVSGGDVVIMADEHIRVIGSAGRLSEISARGYEGPGGSITLRAPEIELLDGGRVAATTTGGGAGGSVNVDQTDRLWIAGSTNVEGTVEASGIFVETRRPVDGGEAGNIDIDVSDLVSVGNGGVLSVATRGSGAGGYIAVQAGRSIVVRDGSSISSKSELSGASGEITLEAGRTIWVDGSQIISKANASQGGNITIKGTGNGPVDVVLDNGALINATAAGLFDAGDVHIENVRQTYLIDSDITTEARQSGGGQVILRAVEKIELVRSTVTTDVLTGAGGGGNLTIDARSVVNNSSIITARADGGPGGLITIIADNYFQSADSPDPDASSYSGPDGLVEIRTPYGSLVPVLTPLDEEFLGVTGLLPAPCAARMSDGQSSFVVRGREGLPVGPDGYLPLPLSPPLPDNEEGEADLLPEASRSGHALRLADFAGLQYTRCPARSRTPAGGDD